MKRVRVIPLVPPCLLEGMHLSALCQPEVDLQINIMKQRDLQIKRKGFHALNSLYFLYNCFHELSYYLSLHLVFIYYTVESRLVSLSNPVWVTYFRGRPELWFMQVRQDPVWSYCSGGDLNPSSYTKYDRRR